MSDDDGLMVNFVAPDSSRVRRQPRIAKYRGANFGGSNKDGSTDGNMTKMGFQKWGKRKSRASEDGTENKEKAPPGTYSSKRTRFAEGTGPGGGKNDTFVSSLFTSNPEVQEHETKEEAVAQDPSNAPLSDATTFDGLGCNEILYKHLTEHIKFQHPTKIQRSVIPRLLTRERDLFVQAQTGSGKTLAFCIPIVQKLMEIEDLKRDSGLFAIILTPTRELATQIYSVLETLTRCCHRIVPGIVIGGEKKKSEKARLRKGVNILVGTPGRLLDHMENTETLDLSSVSYLIMDEGDKLMELGFEETLDKILKLLGEQSTIANRKYSKLPSTRINVLCSATMKGGVSKLGEISLKDAELVTTNSVPDQDVVFDEKNNIQAPDQLVQQILIVPPKLRLVTLQSLLKKITSKTGGSRTMLFLSCSDSVDFHFSTFTRKGRKINSKKVLKETGIEVSDERADESSTILTAPILGDNVFAFKLHGSLTQQVRTSTLDMFSNTPESRHTILFCTDVASRGLDLPYISDVIEYDPPFAVEDHLHRVGRTARAGKGGTSVLFLLPGIEETYSEKIEIYHKKAGLDYVSFSDLLKASFGKTWEVDATTWHLDVERWLLEDPGAHSAAAQAFTSHIRAYATHLSSERDTFNVKTLHLGHLAKSFGLRETPKTLGVGSGPKATKKNKENSKKKLLRMATLAVQETSNEFNY
ncbi:BA75_03291T0 [Komagataella pastoris]|uniref:ATP-dependent RNA helicase n=1 Tax=Komagataella pastoris TaxID=4922 RepID=A0A1B2JCJ7_PICPA|nr:BA75_03291T0 [Komagataella pastoris]